MFPAISDTKNANKAQKMFFQNSAKEKLTDFNIFVAVKRCKDNNKQGNRHPYKMRKIFEGPTLYFKNVYVVKFCYTVELYKNFKTLS